MMLPQSHGDSETLLLQPRNALLDVLFVIITFPTNVPCGVSSKLIGPLKTLEVTVGMLPMVYLLNPLVLDQDSLVVHSLLVHLSKRHSQTSLLTARSESKLNSGRLTLGMTKELDSLPTLVKSGDNNISFSETQDSLEIYAVTLDGETISQT